MSIAICIRSSGSKMPKRGIHPVLHTMTYVLKNGASRQVLTTKKMALPYLLNQVKNRLNVSCSELRKESLKGQTQLQDTTTHPYWTGKRSTLEEGQEGSLARFRKRFGNLGVDFGEEDVQDPDSSATGR